ncbi:hypothetical protein UlMin_039290 [Ulmus minor]
MNKFIANEDKRVPKITRDSDKMIYEHLHKKFEDVLASQTQEFFLDGEQWNDGLLEMSRDTNNLENPQEKINYKVGRNVICSLEGARIGIKFETSFAGTIEAMYFFNQFIHYIGELIQAYVDRREHKLYGNQIGELYHSLPYHMIEFVLDDYDWSVTVTLKYIDLFSLLLSQIRKNSLNALAMNMKDNGISTRQPVLAHLSYAKDALRTMSLLEAYAEIVLNLP